MTFGEVKDFIDNATVNTYGFTKCNSNHRLQIWNTKTQFNVNSCKDESDYGLAQLAIVFHEDAVHLYTCDNGYANYDTYTEYSLAEDIKCSRLGKYGYLFS